MDEWKENDGGVDVEIKPRKTLIICVCFSVSYFRFQSFRFNIINMTDYDYNAPAPGTESEYGYGDSGGQGESNWRTIDRTKLGGALGSWAEVMWKSDGDLWTPRKPQDVSCSKSLYTDLLPPFGRAMTVLSRSFI